MSYSIKCSVFGSAMAQLKLCFSFKFNPLWFPFSVFIFQVMLHKITQKWQGLLLKAGIGKKSKLNFKQYKVNLILQCYLILTINRICYLNLSPRLFWILWAKTNNYHKIHSIRWFDSPMWQRPFMITVSIIKGADLRTL